MLPTSFIEKFFEWIPDDFKEIVFEVRNIVVSVDPAATEEILWKGVCYYDAKRGGPVSANICHVSVLPDHVRLAFLQGVYLADPLGLLEGDQKAKRVLRILSYETAPWDYIRELVRSADQFDVYSMISAR